GGAPAPRGGGGGPAMSAGASAVARQLEARPAPQEPAPTLQRFEDVIALIDQKRDIALRLDVERFVRPISFRTGAIEFEPAPGAPVNLIQRLAARLKEWTGQPWLIAAQGGGGAESLWERQKREERETLDEVRRDPFVKAVMEAFPGAEILGVRSLEAAEASPAPPEDDDEED
ncbi:MAG: DNA polymerase III subunit gamma/tau, partial [Phenylobacterium sp.]